MSETHVSDGPLGRYRPPPGSVVRDSEWRIDPEKAALGYGRALLLAPAAIVAVSVLPTTLHSTADAWLVGTVAVVASLGATKRCFGFGVGTLVGPGWVVALAIGHAVAPHSLAQLRWWSGAFLVGLGLLITTLLIAFARQLDGRRRVAGFAGWGAVAQWLLAVTSRRFDGSGPLAEAALTAGACFAAGTFLVLSTSARRAPGAHQSRSTQLS